MEILPAIPASSWDAIETLAAKLKDVADSFQIDIVDGVFAQPSSWPYTEAEPLRALENVRAIAQNFRVELDLMVAHPELFLDTTVSIGASRIIVHIDSITDIAPFREHSLAHGYMLGLAVMSTTDIGRIEALLPSIDFIQCMGIAVVGAQGQPFDERILSLITVLHQTNPTLVIEVDGSVNRETIPALRSAGVTRFAVGSALSKAPDPIVVFQELTELISIQ